MTYENLIYEGKDGIARITFNRPAAMNTFTFGVLVELQSALRRAEEDEAVRVVVLTGAGRAFSAGVDLNALKDPSTDRKKFSEAAKEALRDHTVHGEGGHRHGERLLPDRGNGIGDGLRPYYRLGGCQVWRYARPLGTCYPLGRKPALPRAVGLLKAKELAFTAEVITGKEAERIGLVNRVVPAEN